ncbi:MAG: trehalose-phosphatase [Chloroflexota bacterium]
MASDLDDAQASTARVRAVARALRQLFSARPAGLLTDVDGTISRITRRTNDATVSAEARRALTRLGTRLDLVTVVTGRAVERAQQMVQVASIGYVGNHGLEWLADGAVQTDPAAEAARPALQSALADVRAAIPSSELAIEDKRVSLAIHYRLATAPAEIGARVLEILEPYARSGSLRLIEGGLVVNVLPAVPIDKGAAARRLVEQHGLRSVAFFGDDVTDLDAFRVLRELRSAGAVDALTVGVGSVEGPPEVRAEADLILEGVGEVERVLTALARPPRSTPAVTHGA